VTQTTPQRAGKSDKHGHPVLRLIALMLVSVAAVSIALQTRTPTLPMLTVRPVAYAGSPVRPMAGPLNDKTVAVHFEQISVCKLGKTKDGSKTVTAIDASTGKMDGSYVRTPGVMRLIKEHTTLAVEYIVQKVPGKVVTYKRLIWRVAAMPLPWPTPNPCISTAPIPVPTVTPTPLS
jgi:hypothetical protein